MSTDESVLSDLAQRLAANGMVVVPFKDYLEIRLPLFASVKVRVANGRLSCEPRFGFLPRDRATWTTLIGLAVITAVAFLQLGVTPLPMVFGFVAVSSSASTAIRYQMTEACITRVQTAFMLLSAGQVRGIATPRSRGELGEPAPPVTLGRVDPVPLKREEK